MSNLFQIGAKDPCNGLLPLVKVIRKGVFPIFWIGIPIILLVMGTVDLGKAVMSSDEKEIKAAQGRLIKRCIYAAAVFFMFTLVSLVMGLLAHAEGDIKANSTGWKACWNEAGE